MSHPIEDSSSRRERKSCPIRVRTAGTGYTHTPSAFASASLIFFFFPLGFILAWAGLGLVLHGAVVHIWLGLVERLWKSVQGILSAM
jgi:hypothetical protein